MVSLLLPHLLGEGMRSDKTAYAKAFPDDLYVQLPEMTYMRMDISASVAFQYDCALVGCRILYSLNQVATC